MDAFIFEEMFKEVEKYKNNIEECSKLFYTLSTLNAQQDHYYDELIARMKQVANPPSFVEVAKEAKEEMSEVLSLLTTQQQIDRTAAAAYLRTALELTKLAKSIDQEG